MKNVFKVLVLSLVASSLVACSSAKKEDDSILADLPQTETSVTESTVQDSSSLIDPVEESTPASSMLEDNSSLGTGSSGLGH